MKLANNTKVLITGSSGFIGNEISQLLVSNNYEIFGLMHKNKSKGNLGGFNYQSLYCDLASSSHIPHLPDKIDVIIHCAAILPKREVPVSRRSEIFALNEAMASNVCEIAKAHNVRLVIFASTANMYKNSLELACEDSEIAPEAEKEYFQSKLNAELLIQEELVGSGISLSILRVTTPYGPGENPAKVIPTFLENAYFGKNLVLLGNLESLQNYCYVSDVAWAFKRCMELNLTGTYNIGSKSSTTLIQLAEEVLSIYPGSNSVIEAELNQAILPRNFAPIDISKSRDQMGFNPTILRTGLRKYANHLGLFVK